MILFLVFMATCLLYGLGVSRMGPRDSFAILALASLLAAVYLITGLI